MPNRLRIARHAVNAYSLPNGASPPTGELYQGLVRLIRRHLSPITTTLFAEPVLSADNQYIEWYTELAGQPTLLASLPPAEQNRVRALLDDRLKALRELARHLPSAGSVSPHSSALLQATTYPGEETIYVVDGQPVITFWGYGSLPEERPVQAAAKRKSPIRLPLILAVALISVLAWAALHFSLLRWPPWGPDYEALLKAAAEEQADLRRRQIDLESSMARALGQCALQTQLEALRQAEGLQMEKLKALETALAEQLAACRVGSELQAARIAEQALNQALASAHKQLAEKLKTCPAKALPPAKDEPLPSAEDKNKQPSDNKDATAASEPEKPSPASKEKLPSCPGERPPEEAPDVAIVLDSSGSMRWPEKMSPGQQRQFEQCQQLFKRLRGHVLLFKPPQVSECERFFSSLSGPNNRLQAAQRSVTNVVRSLPQDVDIGLAVLEDCPGATDYGFYGAAQRQQLLAQVNRLYPKGGTPLANGVWIGGQKVDGVRAPAVIVVISDGEDSCRQNPCAVARQLKSAKPQVKINVVDITGEGYANCLAELTGGRVLSSRSGMPMEQMIREAAGEAKKPAHCK